MTECSKLALMCMRVEKYLKIKIPIVLGLWNDGDFIKQTEDLQFSISTIYFLLDWWSLISGRFYYCMVANAAALAKANIGIGCFEGDEP